MVRPRNSGEWCRWWEARLLLDPESCWYGDTLERFDTEPPWMIRRSCSSGNIRAVVVDGTLSGSSCGAGRLNLADESDLFSVVVRGDGSDAFLPSCRIVHPCPANAHRGHALS